MVLKKKSSADEHKEVSKQETEFRSQARRNRLLGLWLAEKLGLEGEDAAAYSREVVAADLEEPGHDDVLRKVMADIEAKGLGLSREEVLAEMNSLLVIARKQIEQEGAR